MSTDNNRPARRRMRGESKNIQLKHSLAPPPDTKPLYLRFTLKEPLPLQEQVERLEQLATYLRWHYVEPLLRLHGNDWELLAAIADTPLCWHRVRDHLWYAGQAQGLPAVSASITSDHEAMTCLIQQYKQQERSVSYNDYHAPAPFDAGRGGTYPRP